MKEVKDGVCDPDLFFLMLQNDVKKFIEKIITIPDKLRSRGFNKVSVDFYIGSAGNIDINSVNIKLNGNHGEHIAFLVDRNGNFRNNQLSEVDLSLILGLTNLMKFEDSNKYYDLFLLPNIKTS